VRARSAYALGLNGSSAARAATELVRLLTSDPDNEVKRQAVGALGLIGEPSALPALKRAELSSDPHLSRAARHAINLIERRR
jgi:HEAT repeat protein